jgi:hypothetical protein
VIFTRGAYDAFVAARSAGSSSGTTSPAPAVVDAGTTLGIDDVAPTPAEQAHAEAVVAEAEAATVDDGSDLAATDQAATDDAATDEAATDEAAADVAAADETAGDDAGEEAEK